MAEIIHWDVAGWRLCRTKDAFGYIGWCFPYPAKVGERILLYKAKRGEPWEDVENKLRERAGGAGSEGEITNAEL